MPFSFSEFTAQAQKVSDHTVQDLNTLRTGRASSSLLDPVQVEAYGTRMKIGEVANVTAPDATMILVTPWDKSLLGAIERGISIAGLNLNPVVDGQMIRVVVPALTEERRKEMVKLLHQKLETARVMMRNVRSDIKREIEQQKGLPGVSEDAIAADLETLETAFKKQMASIDDLGQRKEKELMTV
ncbi:MAG: ribosome recycling factor [bacterium]|nr:ribosome recycling factor [bacterium]